MSRNQYDLPKATSTDLRSQPTLWHELSETEQQSLAGGRKIEVIIRPFK